MIPYPIKTELQKANRYDQIKQILTGLANDTEGNYPVKAFVNEDGETKWRVNGKDVHDEAKKVLQIIDSKTLEQADVGNLLANVSTMADMHLHNYAVYLSHRKTPTVTMDTVRKYEVLEHLLNHIYKKSYYDEIEATYTIPEGWYKLPSDE